MRARWPAGTKELTLLQRIGATWRPKIQRLLRSRPAGSFYSAPAGDGRVRHTQALAPLADSRRPRIPHLKRRTASGRGRDDGARRPRTGRGQAGDRWRRGRRGRRTRRPSSRGRPHTAASPAAGCRGVWSCELARARQVGLVIAVVLFVLLWLQPSLAVREGISVMLVTVTMLNWRHRLGAPVVSRH